MADITKMFDPVIHAITPHFQTLGVRLQSGFDRVCARLDILADIAAQDEFLEIRRTINLTLTAATEVSLIEVQLGQEYELEVISSLGAMTVTVNESGRFRWAHQYSVPDAKAGEGLILREGNQYTIVSAGNASPVPVSVQLKLRNYPTPIKTRTVGNMEPGVDLTEGPPADDNTNRHGPVNVANGSGSIPRSMMGL